MNEAIKYAHSIVKRVDYRNIQFLAIINIFENAFNLLTYTILILLPDRTRAVCYFILHGLKLSC